MLYVFYITTTPYLPCNNNNINRKELYDFYYTAITLTTGYKIYLLPQILPHTGERAEAKGRASLQTIHYQRKYITV